MFLFNSLYSHLGNYGIWETPPDRCQEASWTSFNIDLLNINFKNNYFSVLDAAKSNYKAIIQRIHAQMSR